jgi:hypothetical protein
LSFLATIAWLEALAIWRRPLWLLLIGAAAWSFYTGVGELAPVVSLGQELPFLALDRTIVSIGEWGRVLFLFLEAFGGVYLSLIVALVTVGALAPEARHREVLWSTSHGGRLWHAGARVLAVTSLTTFALALGACASFLNPATRRGLVLAGWPYLPLYLGLMWVRVAIWVALCMTLFSLTRSRLAAVFLVFAAQTAWFGTAGISGDPSLLQLVHRSLVSWNFVSVFAPLGIIPEAFVLQALGTAGLVLALLGGDTLVMGRYPERARENTRMAAALVVVGLTVAAGSIAGVVGKMGGLVAPFTAAEIWDGKADWGRFYIWSADLRLLALPGGTTVLRLPPGMETPRWAERLGKEVWRFEKVGRVVLERDRVGRWWMDRTADATLVLISPAPAECPTELAGSWRRFKELVSPLIERANPWLQGHPQLAFSWWPDTPPVGGASDMCYIDDRLLVPYSVLLGNDAQQLWEAAWALTHTSGGHVPERVYLTMYLMAESAPDELQRMLRYLEDVVSQEEWLVNPTIRPPYSTTFWSASAPGRDPEVALEVLNYWRDGEAMGHEAFIRSLFGGGPG